MRLEVYSESTITLSNSNAIPNVIPHKMVKKLHLPMMLTNRFSKIWELCPEKCGYVQGDTGKHGKVGSTNNFLVLEDTPRIYLSVCLL